MSWIIRRQKVKTVYTGHMASKHMENNDLDHMKLLKHIHRTCSMHAREQATSKAGLADRQRMQKIIKYQEFK